MKLTVKKFTKELKSDFFDFFDNRAFTDASPYYPCYCDAYYLTPEDVRINTKRRTVELGGGKEGLRLALQESAEKLIDGGIMQGYLAYDGDTAIGWCNSGEKAKYVRAGDLNPAYRREGDIYFENVTPGETFSFICFEVAPDHRRMGVAKALLDFAVRDAAANGYRFCEAYPKAEEKFDVLDFTGPFGMYLNAGFYETGRSGKSVIMKKDL